MNFGTLQVTRRPTVWCWGEEQWVHLLRLLWGSPMVVRVGKDPQYRGAEHCNVIYGRLGFHQVLLQVCYPFCFLLGYYQYSYCLEFCIGLGKHYLWFNSQLIVWVISSRIVICHFACYELLGGCILLSGFQCVWLLFWFFDGINSRVLFESYWSGLSG